MEKERVIIVDHEGVVGRTTFRDVNLDKGDVIVVDISNKVNVNGQLYEEITPSKNKSKSEVIANMVMAEYSHYYKDYERKLSPKIDIVKEFGLIQLKKSNLKRWERDQVVYLFNKKFKKVE